jgi:hypothetical protein
LPSRFVCRRVRSFRFFHWSETRWHQLP